MRVPPLLLLLCTAPLFSQQPPQNEFVVEVNRAIDKGCDWLLEAQQIDGSWEFLDYEYRSGHTALVTYSLLKCGVPHTDPAIRRAFAYMRAHPVDRTYSAGCFLLALEATNDEQFPLDRAAWAADVARKLVEWREGRGLFHYNNGGSADLSNTLFAAMGLAAADRMGVPLPRKLWSHLTQATLLCQENGTGRATTGVPQRGFSYRPSMEANGSMTTAGVTILELCRRRLDPRDRRAVAATRAIEQGVAWIADRFDLATNPADPNNNWHYYWLYGLERVGDLVGLEQFGEHEWYRPGARYLLTEQAEWGSWTDSAPTNREAIDTCLALLFLRRATVADAVTGARAEDAGPALKRVDGEVSLCASGDTPLVLWLGGFGEAARLWEWEGESGKGPHVEKVEYFAHRDGDPKEFLVATVSGDPAIPAGGNRFALQHRFANNGRYALRARAHLLPERAESETVIVESPPLVLSIQGVTEEWRLAYASDSKRNLLAPNLAKAEASSFLGDGWSASFAADNSMARRWACRVDDTDPWIRLQLRKPVRASRLLLTHWHTKQKLPNTARASSVEVRLDRDKEWIPLTMDLDPQKKTVLEFGESRRVRQVEVRITGLAYGTFGSNYVGFSEIELQ